MVNKLRLYTHDRVDDEFQALGVAGHTGSLNDRIKYYLINLGYTGSLGDMLNTYHEGAVAPVISNFSTAGAPDSMSFDVDVDCTCYWLLDQTATQTAAAVIAGGTYDGSQAITSPSETIAVDFSAAPDGSYYLHIVCNNGASSNVIDQAVELTADSFVDTFAYTIGTKLTEQITPAVYTRLESQNEGVKQMSAGVAGIQDANSWEVIGWTGDTADDHFWEVTIGTGVSSGFTDVVDLYARYVDANNYIRMRGAALVTHSLIKCIAGTETIVDATQGAFTDGTLLRIQVIGDTVKTFEDGVEVHSYTHADLDTGGVLASGRPALKTGSFNGSMHYTKFEIGDAS